MNDKLSILGGKPVLKKPLSPYKSIGKEEKLAVKELLDSGFDLSGFLGFAGVGFLGGQLVKKFESDFKKYFNMRYAVSFNSATTSLQAALAALGIGPGDQVITSPFTMSATATSILFNNAVPVFADVDPKTYCLCADSIEKRINKNTKAIIVVNIFGGTADYTPIIRLAKKYKLKIIEDSSQAPGATYKGRLAGTIGDIGVFSFNVHKVIQSGEGGMLVTNNEKYAYRAQLVRNHGEVTSDDLWNNKDIPRELVAGSNYRLTEIQAAIMIEQLKKLSSLNNCRIALADYLSEKLKKFSWLRGPNVLAKSKHIYYLYPIKFLANKIGISRKTFIQAMLDEGFSLGAGYQKPLYLLKIYQNKRIYQSSQFPFVSKEYPQKFDYSKGICPVVEKMYEEEIFTTNICQSPKTKKDIDLFVKALEKIDKNIDLLKKYEREV